MKKNTIVSLILTFLLTCFYLVSAHAATTPTLQFQAQPLPTNAVVANGTLNLNFVVHNLAPQPTPINVVSFNVDPTLVPVSPTITFSCGGTSSISIPANGSCTVTVSLSAGTKVGSTTQSLVINYGARQTQLVSNPISVNVVDVPVLTFVPPQPAAQNMVTNTQQILTYTVQNNSLDSAINISDIAALPSSSLLNETYANNCNNTVPQRGTCVITVTINALSTPGAVNQNLVVSYASSLAPQTQTVQSNAIAFDIVPPPPQLIFQQEPTPSNMNTNSQQILTYTVANSSPNVAINLLTQTISFKSGINLVAESVSNDCSNTVPGGGTCHIIVTVNSLQTAGTVVQNLVVQYNSPSDQQIQTLVSSDAAFDVMAVAAPTLEFVAPQPTAANMNTNSQQILTYTVANSSPNVAINLGNQTVSFQTGGSLVTETVSNDCGNTVPGGGTCHIAVTINSLQTAGAVIQNLNVQYNIVSDPQTQTLVSSDVTFNVTAVDPPALEFVAPQPVAKNMGFDSQQILTYAVLNQSSTTDINIQSIAVAPSFAEVTESITNDCNNVVPANQLCHITLTINSGSVDIGQVKQTLTVSYNSIVQPQTQSISSNPISFAVVGITPPVLTFEQPIPTAQDMQFNQTQNLVYTVKNSSNVFSVQINSIVLDPLFAGLVTETITNSCANVVPAGGTCQITVEIDSLTTVGAVDQSLDIVYNSLPSPIFQTLSQPISFNVVASGRKIAFNNQCPFTVWFGTSGGAVPSKLNVYGACNTSSDCYANTNCVNNFCYAINPVPANNSFELTTGTSNSVTIPIPVNNINPQGIIWSGTLAARTGCVGSACDTAQCTNGSDSQGVCSVAVGFQTPNSQGEFTLLNMGADTYNLSIINGFNVPLEFGPDPLSGGIPDPTNPYTCGISGAIVDQTVAGNTIGKCSWQFTSPSAVYVNIKQTTPVTACTTNAQCGSNTCGATLSDILSTAYGATPKTTCGTFLGYWSGAQICSLNENVGAPLFCYNPANMPAPFTSLKMVNLFQCQSPAGVTGVPSCYTSGSQSEQCCGCVNWQDEGMVVPTDPNIVQQCNPPSTTSWANGVLPTITWTKQACPSAYTYQFDDKTSTFTCTNQPSGTLNTTNYVVTFCPGGKTGK